MTPSPDSTDPSPTGNDPRPVTTVKSLLSDLGNGVFAIVILRGILAVLFGLLVVVAPDFVAVTLGIYIGVWLVVDGILTITNAITARKAALPWGWELASGIAYVVAGLVVVISPLTFTIIGGAVLLWMMAFGMFARGVFGLVSRAFRGWSKLLGVLDIIFAIVLMIVLFRSPAAAVATLLWIVGIYAVVFGVFLIVMAIMVRSQGKKAMH